MLSMHTTHILEHHEPYTLPDGEALHRASCLHNGANGCKAYAVSITLASRRKFELWDFPYVRDPHNMELVS